MSVEFKSGCVSEFDVHTSIKGDKIKKGLSAPTVMNLTNKLRSKTDHVLDLQQQGWLYGFPAELKIYEEGSTRGETTYLCTVWNPCCHSTARH